MAVSARVVLTLPCLPIAELAANARPAHWSERHRWVRYQAEIWLIELRKATWEGMWDDKPAFTKPVSIDVTLRGTGRRSDVPNWMMHGGLKVLIDALCVPRGNRGYGVGLIQDDSLRYLTAVTVRVEPKGVPSTVVSIEETC